MNVQDRIDNAVPALGYSPRTTEAAGWKVNFDPEQPRDEDGKWTAAGEYAAKLDTYAAEYQTEGRVAEAAAATQAALLLRGHDYRASETVLREAELHRDLPNTHIAILRAADEAYIAKNYGVNWGMEAGTFTAWRAGAVTGTPRGVFFSIDKAGADAYGADGRATHRYSVAIKNPLVIDRLEPAYAQLTGKSLDAVYAEKNRRDPMKWWRDTDAKIGRLAQAKGYDAIVYTRPAPPAIRELVVFDKKAITLDDEPKANAQDEEGNEGRWVTMHGTPVFIKNGEDPKAAMSRTFAKDKPRGTERPRPKQPGAFKRWWREAVSDAKQVLFHKRSPQQETQKTQPTGGKVPNAALQHFPRQVDMVFDGKLSSQQVVDGLMKSGMIRTGTASRELTRARYVKEFDKAVVLMEQQAAERQSPGGGKNAYTDKGEKAKLRTGQSLAEKFFAPHIDQLADGMMSVTSKVDELASRGELGVRPGEPGFIKLRETVIKDFTKALNRRETLDRRYEKQRLKTDKPKKLTKREQQAAWMPSEEELAASGPVVGTGWKRNMAENQPRDEQGRWTLSGSKLAGALTSLYGAQPTPPADGKGWLRPDGLFIGGGGVSHVAMLRAAYDDRKGKAPAFAEDMYRLAFRAGMVRFDRHAGVIEISGAPTEDQKTSLRKLFDGLGTFDEIEVEVFRTPETRYYSEQDRESHRRWMETSPDSMVEKVDAFYGSKGDGYISPLAAFRGNAFDPNQPRDEDGKWTGDVVASMASTLDLESHKEELRQFLQATNKRVETLLTEGDPTCTVGAGVAGDFFQKLGKPVTYVSGDYNGQGHWWILVSVPSKERAGFHDRYVVDVGNNLTPEALATGKITPVFQRSGGGYVAEDYMGRAQFLKSMKEAGYSKGAFQLDAVPKTNAFDPNQPRDEDGKWTGGTLNFDNEPSRVGGFTKDVAVRRSTVMKGEERVTTWHNPDGSQITDPKLVARAEQLNGTKATAPNYKGAWLNPDTESPLLAIAFDSKDRKQYIYSREFVQKNAEAKFKIVEQMKRDLPVMRKQAAADRKAGTPEAFLFKLEDLTCIRVGSDRDTGAEKKAYGLTTLRGEHVKVEGDLIKLEFPAKGGKSGAYTVKDKELATFVAERKTANGNGPLWPDVTAGKFNAYLKGLDPTTDTPVTAHKFRHYHATRIAAEVVARYEGEELSPKAFTRVQKEACEKAAAHLSNTWTVTREKYVNPTVWGRLTVKAG